MSPYHVFELLIVAAAVAASAYAALLRLAPQVLGKTTAQAKNCGTCNSCNGCAKPADTRQEQPVRWQR